MKNALSALLSRFVAFLVFWLILDAAKPAGLVIGLPAAALATWISVKLLPPLDVHPSPMGLLAFCGHFLWGSLVARVDVAIRVFDPRLPLRAGFIACPCGIPPGARRDLFLAVASLMPGSLPVEAEEGRIILHVLDLEQPRAAEMIENEARLRRALEFRPSNA